MKKYILALDQGTTSSRAVLFDHGQNVVDIRAMEYPQIYPQPGWVEHDPYVILNSQKNAMERLLEKSGVKGEQLAAIGITNQRETTLVWERETGSPIFNAIVWQCRRTSEMCEALYRDGHDKYIREVTGLIPDAYFSATKIRWILDHVEGAQQRAERGELCAGTVDSWLVWNLTGGKAFVTDYTNASRTMLYNIHQCKWDEKLLELFDIPESMLPEVLPSSHGYGYAEIGGAQVPIAGIAGDQQASLFGQACFEERDAKNTYGTGCFLLMNTGETPVKSENGLLTTIAYGVNGKVCYALEGSVFNAGSVVQWLRDEQRLIESASQMSEICASCDDTGGVYMVPAFTGLGAPHWNMRARGCIVGITRGTTREHLIRAVEESIAYQVGDVMRAMEKDIGADIPCLKVDGGASRDSFLLQFQADILGATIQRGYIQESSALGAAYLAGLAVGFWKDMGEIKAAYRLDKEIKPQMEKKQRNALCRGWSRAVERSLDWEEA
ncbi:MAG: glycerol kinase GlpK [Oscillospiraceae bacterium]